MFLLPFPADVHLYGGGSPVRVHPQEEDVPGRRGSPGQGHEDHRCGGQVRVQLSHCLQQGLPVRPRHRPLLPEKGRGFREILPAHHLQNHSQRSGRNELPNRDERGLPHRRRVRASGQGHREELRGDSRQMGRNRRERHIATADGHDGHAAHGRAWHQHL